MPRVLVWKCPHTGNLFEDQTNYRRHLANLALQRARQRRIALKIATFQATMEKFRHSCTSFEEITDWMKANTSVLYYNSSLRYPKNPCPTITAMTFDRMRWNRYCSNSHVAPKGRPTNWRSEPGIPTGYPGWTGTIRFSITNRKSLSWPSDLLKLACIKTASGGGSNDGHFTYDVTIFAEDFPNIAMNELMHGRLKASDLAGILA